MQSIAETCVRFDAAHLSINLVSEIAVPMFPSTLNIISIRPSINFSRASEMIEVNNSKNSNTVLANS